jgi:translation elongation factor EF-1alpha
LKKFPKFLTKGNVAKVLITLSERSCMELYKNFKNMGRISLREG